MLLTTLFIQGSSQWIICSSATQNLFILFAHTLCNSWKPNTHYNNVQQFIILASQRGRSSRYSRPTFREEPQNTALGKTGDLTPVRGPLVDDFRKEGEPKKVTMSVLALGRALSMEKKKKKKHWKEKCEDKKNGSGDCSLERIVKKSKIKELGLRLTRGGLRLGVATSRLRGCKCGETRHRQVPPEKATMPRASYLRWEQRKQFSVRWPMVILLDKSQEQHEKQARLASVSTLWVQAEVVCYLQVHRVATELRSHCSHLEIMQHLARHPNKRSLSDFARPANNTDGLGKTAGTVKLDFHHISAAAEVSLLHWCSARRKNGVKRSSEKGVHVNERGTFWRGIFNEPRGRSGRLTVLWMWNALCQWDSLAINWRTVKGLIPPPAWDCWDRLQQPPATLNAIEAVRESGRISVLSVQSYKQHSFKVETEKAQNISQVNGSTVTESFAF